MAVVYFLSHATTTDLPNMKENAEGEMDKRISSRSSHDFCEKFTYTTCLYIFQKVYKWRSDDF